MAEFNDRRSDKKVDLAAKALSDAKKDSKSTYGRQHGSSYMFPKHHSSEANYYRCKACQADLANGTHPLGPTERIN